MNVALRNHHGQSPALAKKGRAMYDKCRPRAGQLAELDACFVSAPLSATTDRTGKSVKPDERRIAHDNRHLRDELGMNAEEIGANEILASDAKSILEALRNTLVNAFVYFHTEDLFFRHTADGQESFGSTF